MQSVSDTLDRDDQPSRWSSLVFECKAWGLRLRRMALDFWRGRPARHAPASALAAAGILAEFEGHLWPKDEADQTLVAGKIQNLRLAVRNLNGLEIPADGIFSFWRQLGRASASRGFVAGRELREGCIVPATGGGLCQLSNAIYDSAVRAGLEVVERHRHSRALPGSLAERDRDATVFWNYVDLRLRAPFAWRLEVHMDEAYLRVRIRSARQEDRATLPLHLGVREATDVGDCSTCEERACYRHIGTRQLSPHRTWLIDEQWPEFMTYLDEHRDASRRTLGIAGANHESIGTRCARGLAWLRWRIAIWRKLPIPQARNGRSQMLAKALASQLHADDLHLVVAQSLLPYLWQAGELAGRRYDVLMSALPMTAIQRRLDDAANRHPGSATLRDFRAPDWLIAAESEALARAHRWISPHEQILTLAGSRGERLPWHLAASAPAGRPSTAASPRPMRIFFPASSLARKGALELRDAVRDLPIGLLVLGQTEESPDFWRGVDVQRVNSIAEGLASADLVVLPAWVEHQPRGLLLAIDRGIPVIATAACGLPTSTSWRCVTEGDCEDLRDQIRRAQDQFAARTDRLALA